MHVNSKFVYSKKTKDTLSEHEQSIKEELEQWIIDVQKKAELNQRLQLAFQNSKNHIQSSSQM